MAAETSPLRPHRASARGAATSQACASSGSSWALPAGARIGPAHVIEVEGEGPLRVLLSSGERVEVIWALPYRYQACPGDLLLVVSRGERHYALNVLQGRGRSVLAVAGDGLLRAGAGKLRLRGERGVKLRSARVTLRAQVLSRVARVVHEKVDQARASIRGKVFSRAGSSRRVLEGDDWHSAGERTLVAADAVTFNGDLIRVS